MFHAIISEFQEIEAAQCADQKGAGAAIEKKIRVAVIEDDLEDYFLLKYMLKKSDDAIGSIQHFQTTDDYLATNANAPDVIILDRCLPGSELSENRISELRAKNPHSGIILYTSAMTPSLRTTAAHEGAVAVVEKGTLDARALTALLEAAAVLGPSM